MASVKYYCFREKNSTFVGKWYDTKREYDEKTDGFDTEKYEFRIFQTEYTAMNWCARKESYRDVVDNGYRRDYSPSVSPISNHSSRSNVSRFSKTKEYKRKTYHGRAEVAYEKKTYVTKKIKEEKFYAVAFGNSHGVFDLKGFSEAIEGCSYARHQEKNSEHEAQIWCDKERNAFLSQLLDENFSSKCPRLEGESDDDWLDRAVAYFEKENIEFVPKRRTKTKIVVVQHPIIDKQEIIPPDLLDLPIEGEKITTRHLCTTYSGIHMAILTHKRIGIANTNKWHAQKYDTYALAYAVYETALNS